MISEDSEPIAWMCRLICLYWLHKSNCRFYCVLAQFAFNDEAFFHYFSVLSHHVRCLYNFDPLKPHFFIVKLGFAGVYIIFLIFARKHRLWVLIRTASSRGFE